MKTLQLLSTQSCQIFCELKSRPQKMQFFDAIKKVASLGTLIQNAKWRENPRDAAVTEAKWVRIPMFWHISGADEQAQICICRSMGKECLENKFLRF